MSAVAYSPNSKFLATASGDGVVTLRHTNTWAVQRILRGDRAEVNGAELFSPASLAFSPNGSLLASGSGIESGSLKVWKVQNGTALWSLPPNDAAVSAVAFSPNGKTIAGGGGLSGIRLWDTQTGRLQQELDHGAWARSIAFSPDGSWLATPNGDGVVLHSFRGAKTRRTFKYLKRSVQAVAFSPNGRMLVVAYNDQRFVLWDVRTGNLLKVVQSPSKVNTVAFSPNASMLATGHYDGTVRLWRIKQ
jgi:WD40 repeat protein